MIESTTPEQRQWACFANLAGLLTLSHIPFANIAGPLVIYFKARNENSPFVLQHARASLNFQITFSLAIAVALVYFVVDWLAFGISFALAATHERHAILPFGLFGWIFGAAMLLLYAQLVNVVLCVLATIAASNGRTFRYPSIPFVR